MAPNVTRCDAVQRSRVLTDAPCPASLILLALFPAKSLQAQALAAGSRRAP